MKEMYIKPQMKVVKLYARTRLMSGSPYTVSKTNSNLGGDDDFEYGGGSNGYAR